MERIFTILEVGVWALCILVIGGALVNKAADFWETARVSRERRKDNPVTMACIGLGLAAAILMGLVYLWPPRP